MQQQYRWNIKMVIITGWKKYRDSPRLGLGWINNDIDRELKLKQHPTMKHWILSVNNGTGRILSEVDMFHPYKTKQEGIDSATKYMKSTAVKKVSKNEPIQAVVRVIPLDEDDEKHTEASMSFEYKSEDYDLIAKMLSKDKRVKEFEWNGNAINIEAISKEPIINIKNYLSKKYPKIMYKGYADGIKYDKPFQVKAKVGIEWNYWVE